MGFELLGFNIDAEVGAYGFWFFEIATFKGNRSLFSIWYSGSRVLSIDLFWFKIKK